MLIKLNYEAIKERYLSEVITASEQLKKEFLNEMRRLSEGNLIIEGIHFYSGRDKMNIYDVNGFAIHQNELTVLERNI